MSKVRHIILFAFLWISAPSFGSFDVTTGRNSEGKTAYEVLRLAPDASPEELKAARARLLDMHPDRTGLADSTVQEKMTAYGMIRTPELREKYDQILRGQRPAQASPLRAEFLGDSAVGQALQQDLLRTLNKQFIGRGVFKVVRLDKLEKFSNEPGFEILDKAFKYLFSPASLKYDYWNRIAASLSDDEFTKKTYVVVVPAGANTLGTDVAGVLNHADNLDFGTYYMGDDILPEQGNSFERRSEMRMKYIKSNSAEFRGSSFLFVNPAGIEKMRQQLGRDISISAIAHELTHIHDTELLRRWVRRNLDLNKSGKPVHPFFKEVGRIREGYAYLSYSFYQVLIESRAYAISRLIEQRLQIENLEKYDRAVRKELTGYRSGLGQELPQILEKMQLNWVNLPDDHSNERFFKILNERALGEKSIFGRIQAATAKADRDACWLYLERPGKVLGEELQ